MPHQTKVTKIHICVPTYNRPKILKEFVGRHLSLAREENIEINLYHNEPNPQYNGSDDKINVYYNPRNQGLHYNVKRIMCEQSNRDGYSILCSDQEIINLSELLLLASELKNCNDDLIYFERGDANKAKWGLETQTGIPLWEWLQTVPFTETTFMFKNSIQLRKSLSYGYFKTNLPLQNHALLLNEKNLFRGGITSYRVFQEDELGSVSSGWTQWPPNIIICHLVYLKYLIYIARSNSMDVNCNAIKGLIPGLSNHMLISNMNGMYSGIRLGKLAKGVEQQLRNLMTNAEMQIFKDYINLNSRLMKELSDSEIQIIDTHKEYIKKFQSIYPEWNYYPY